MRNLFFVIASVWGFVLGTAAAALLLRQGGRPFDVHAGVVLAGGAVVAALGAIVVATAYRENRRRH